MNLDGQRLGGMVLVETFCRLPDEAGRLARELVAVLGPHLRRHGLGAGPFVGQPEGALAQEKAVAAAFPFPAPIPARAPFRPDAGLSSEGGEGVGRVLVAHTPGADDVLGHDAAYE